MRNRNRSVAVVIDGRSFFYQTRDLKGDDTDIGFNDLGMRLAEAAKCKDMELYHGLHYITGVNSKTDTTSRFIRDIAQEPGVHAIGVDRGSVDRKCSECGAENSFKVDSVHYVTFTVETLRLVQTHGLTDVVFVLADRAWVPLLTRLKDMGVCAWIASVGQPDEYVSRAVQREAWGFIDMKPLFLRSLKPTTRHRRHEPEHDASEARSATEQTSDEEQEFQNSLQEDLFLDELERAMVRFREGYVGQAYFLNRWRGSIMAHGVRLTDHSRERRAIMDALVKDGDVIVYQAADGTDAIRTAWDVDIPAEPAGKPDVGPEDEVEVAAVA